MEKKTRGLENYPFRTVFVINLISLSVYAAGLYLTYLVWPPFSFLYLVYVIYSELSLYRHCASCYYYGKVCAFGKGKVAALIFSKNDPKKFGDVQFGSKEMMKGLLVPVIPVIAGAWLLLVKFSPAILALAAWPLIVMFLGNPLIYGRLACPHCRQGEICCPASDFFTKGRKGRAKKAGSK